MFTSRPNRFGKNKSAPSKPFADVQETKRVMLEQLRRDAVAHEQGNYAAIGDGYESLYDFDVCLADDGTGDAPSAEDTARYAEYERLRVAEAFWARWQDARNHDWKFYSGISANDWPILARQLCDDIEAGYDADTLRKRARVFDVPYTAPWWFHLLGRVFRSHDY